MNSIVIDGKEIRVSLQPSERARKTVDIEFRSKEELIVTLPRGQDVDTEILLRKNKALINRKYREFLNKIYILNDDGILFNGKRYEIRVLRVTLPQEEPVSIDGGVLNIQVRKKENPSKILKKWISQQTRIQIDYILEKRTCELGSPIRIFITDTKRWGYTRKNGEVIFNWQLSTLPPELSEYVIVHELVHLAHMNHSKGFHNRMTGLMPNYRAKEKKLKYYKVLEAY